MAVNAPRYPPGRAWLSLTGALVLHVAHVYPLLMLGIARRGLVPATRARST